MPEPFETVLVPLEKTATNPFNLLVASNLSSILTKGRELRGLVVPELFRDAETRDRVQELGQPSGGQVTSEDEGSELLAAQRREEPVVVARKQGDGPVEHRAEIRCLAW